MDVLLTITVSCPCCSARSAQPVTTAIRGFRPGMRAALDGVATDPGPRRGLQLCPSCGHAAPSLAEAGATPALLRTAVAAPEHGAALGRRCVGATARPQRAEAMRWLAYATTLAPHLAPEAAGLAYVHAAAELEQPQLLPLGATGPQPACAAEAAEQARRAAIAHLMPVLDAEFGPAILPRPLAVLRRALARWRLGERMRRPAAWHVSGHHIEDRRAEGRFELACTLADLLRRAGEFVAAESVALRALRDAAVPAHLAALLGYQLRLARSRDQARHEQHAVPGNVVALPAAEPAREDVLDHAQAAAA